MVSYCKVLFCVLFGGVLQDSVANVVNGVPVYYLPDVCNHRIIMPSGRAGRSIILTWKPENTRCESCLIMIQPSNFGTILMTYHGDSYHMIPRTLFQIAGMENGRGQDLSTIQAYVSPTAVAQFYVKCNAYFKWNDLRIPQFNVTFTEMGSNYASESSTSCKKAGGFYCLSWFYCLPRETICNGALDCPGRSSVYGDEGKYTCGHGHDEDHNNDDGYVDTRTDGMMSNVYVAFAGIVMGLVLLCVILVILKRIKSNRRRRSSRTRRAIPMRQSSLPPDYADLDFSMSTTDRYAENHVTDIIAPPSYEELFAPKPPDDDEVETQPGLNPSNITAGNSNNQMSSQDTPPAGQNSITNHAVTAVDETGNTRRRIPLNREHIDSYDRDSLALDPRIGIQNRGYSRDENDSSEDISMSITESPQVFLPTSSGSTNNQTSGGTILETDANAGDSTVGIFTISNPVNNDRASSA